MEAIAAGDVVAIQAQPFAVAFEGHVGALTLQVVQAHLGGLVDGSGAAGFAGLHEVAGDLGLAVDHHRLAAAQALQVDAPALPGEGDLHAFVDQPVARHAPVDAGLAQQVDHTLFQHAGADAAEHVVRGLAFEDHVVDAGLVQQLAEQEAVRTGADDGDLSLHCG